MGALAVARKKAKTGRPKSGLPPRVIAFALKSTEEWRDWLRRLAEAERMGISDLVDRAIADYASKVGFPDPPPKR